MGSLRTRYRSLHQLFRGLFQHDLEALDYELSPRVAQPKKNHADASSTTGRDDLAEIKIECQYDTLLTDCLLEDFAVRQSLQPIITEVDRVMAG
jgi:hypothetical protein